MPQHQAKQAAGKIKLVVCDLDGTLLNSRKEISPRSIAAVQAARKKGIEVTFCTGRIHTMLQVYSRAIGLEQPLAAANGAVITNGKTGQIYSARPVEHTAAEAVFQYCLENNLDCSVLAREGGIFTQESGRIQRFEQYNRFAAREGLPLMPIIHAGRGFTLPPACAIYKLLISGLGAAQTAAAEKFLTRFPALGYTSSDTGLLDISAAGVSKGGGVRKLCALFGVTAAQVCVFGDYYNDISMLEEAGLPVAMAGAPEDVKKKALLVAPSNDEDGVAAVLEQYIL